VQTRGWVVRGQRRARVKLFEVTHCPNKIFHNLCDCSMRTLFIITVNYIVIDNQFESQLPSQYAISTLQDDSELDILSFNPGEEGHLLKQHSGGIANHKLHVRQRRDRGLI
jgi:hypothetical protein